MGKKNIDSDDSHKVLGQGQDWDQEKKWFFLDLDLDLLLFQNLLHGNQSFQFTGIHVYPG